MGLYNVLQRLRHARNGNTVSWMTCNRYPGYAMDMGVNCLVVLGPTASGKTALGVALARVLDGEILSADSRQVYRGLDIGSGKDLSEYAAGGAPTPYHLIDIVDLSEEFHVFGYQRAFYRAFEDVRARMRLPVIVGGTGMYLEAALCGYQMVEAPPNPEVREELAALDMPALAERLRGLRPRLHNTTDLGDRERLIRAIEIAEHMAAHEDEPVKGVGAGAPGAPDIRPLLLGTLWPMDELRQRIAARLRARLDAGLIEEVAQLHAQGHSWERLERLGLEYRFCAAYLQGNIRDLNDLFQKLQVAIGQFAKRQMTWFRRMERQGSPIHWVPRADVQQALRVVRAITWTER